MIDFHTHILPEIDDGASSEEMAKAMLETALMQGVKTIVFTPHYYGKYSIEEFIKRRQNAFERIEKLIPEGVEVFLGAEVYFDGVNLSTLEELSLLSIGDTKYVLLELPFMEKWSNTLIPALARLIEETDCIPILAHLERYVEVRKNPALISKFIEMGCLIQLNTSAFLKGKGKSFAYALLKKGMVHGLGTDTHDIQKRVSDYDKAKEEIFKTRYKTQFDEIQNTMRLILEGETYFPSNGKKIKKLFGFYY